MSFVTTDGTDGTDARRRTSNPVLLYFYLLAFTVAGVVAVPVAWVISLFNGPAPRRLISAQEVADD